VDDNLAALRIRETEAAKLEQTISSSDRALTVATAQYRAGTNSYLTVLASQATLAQCAVKRELSVTMRDATRP